MNFAISLPIRRALALTILAGVLLLLWTILLHPVIRLTADRQEEIESLSEQISRLQMIIARKPRFQRQAEAMQTASASTGGFWTNGSDAAAIADIQNLLRQTVLGAGGQLKSTSGESGVIEQGFRRVTVQLDIQGSLQTIESVLNAVETASPFLFVDSLTVTAPESNFAPDRPPSLILGLKVAGYMRSRGT